MTRPLSLTQVMFCRDVHSMQELGPLVFATFQELERFFAPTRLLKHVAQVRMFSKGQGDLLAPSTVEVVRDFIGRVFTKTVRQPAPPDVEASEQSWTEAKGRFRNTVDPDKLILIVKRQLAPFSPDDRLLIVTDQEITPPEQWRYRLWAVNDHEQATVVSLNPMNPQSWSSERSTADLPVLKHRIRSACIRKLAKWCGLQDCDQDNCYLFRHIESAESLDFLTVLGAEHGIESPEFADVINLEFVAVSDPAKIQDLRKRSSEAGRYA
jgi:hypothetical protein